MSNAGNVSVGKPKIGGAIFRAPLGTPLPTDARSELNKAFKGLGYCSDDGLTNTNTAETDDVKAWGGDRILSLQTSKNDTFTFNLVEVLNVDVLKTVYGDNNVIGTLNTGITIKANTQEQEEYSWVIDMLLKNGTIYKRIVIPSAKVSEVGEIPYKDDTAVNYPTTLACVPDTDGNTHYEYIQRKTTLGSPEVEAEDGTFEMFGTLVSDMQTGVAVNGTNITGTLKYLNSGALVDRWGAGNFLCLKFGDFDSRATSVMVGLDPSYGSGLVEIIDDPDKNGAFKITDKDEQVFKVVSTDGTYTTTDTYNLSDLVCEEA